MNENSLSRHLHEYSSQTSKEAQHELITQANEMQGHVPISRAQTLGISGEHRDLANVANSKEKHCNTLHTNATTAVRAVKDGTWRRKRHATETD